MREGDKIGRLTLKYAIEYTYLGKNRNNLRRKWACICECGSLSFPFDFSLKSGITVSCGCFHKDNTSHLQNLKKLRGDKFKYAKEYKIWSGVKARCTFPSATGYKFYGGRGISFDTKWNTFEGFLEDMGPCPNLNSSIERKDFNGNYCKENCFWLDKKYQNRNTRKTRKAIFKGIEMPLVEIAEINGICSKKLYSRFLIYNEIKKLSLEEVIKCLQEKK